MYLGKKEKEEEKLLEGKHNNNLTTASKQNLNKKLLSVTNHHHDYIIVQRPVKSIKMKLIGTGAYLKLQQLWQNRAACQQIQCGTVFAEQKAASYI